MLLPPALSPLVVITSLFSVICESYFCFVIFLKRSHSLEYVYMQSCDLKFLEIIFFKSPLFNILWRVDRIHAATCGQDSACGSSAAWVFREFPLQHQAYEKTLHGNLRSSVISLAAHLTVLKICLSTISWGKSIMEIMLYTQQRSFSFPYAYSNMCKSKLSMMPLCSNLRSYF